MASIGHVCLQWARLEMALLGIIYAIEGVAVPHGELIYGGMPIQARVNMAMRLAEFHKIPLNLQKRLKAVRKALNDHLLDQRNQIVHGAHRDFDEKGSTTLTMVSWRGAKRDKTLTAIEINDVAAEIFNLANECWSIRDDFGTWKFGPHRDENGGSDFASPEPVTRLKFGQRLRARVQHLGCKIL